jgi:hypothetical protein
VQTWLPVVLVAVLCSCGRTGGLDPSQGVFVTVGDRGSAFVSEDGRTWESARPPTLENLIHITSGAGRFVAVGAKGTIVTSTDGRAWTKQDSGATTDLTGITFTGDRFVAVGGDWTNGAVTLTSADGQNWAAIASPSSQMFQAVVARGGELLVSSNLRSDLLTPSLYKMKHGASWEVAAGGPSFAHGFTEASGRTFVVGSGGGARSSDGVSWEPLGLRGAHAIASSGSGYAAVGEIAGVWASADGVRWTTGRIQSGAYFLAGIAWGRDVYVAVAEPGFAVVSPEAPAANTQIVNVSEQALNDVTFGPAH